MRRGLVLLLAGAAILGSVCLCAWRDGGREAQEPPADPERQAGGATLQGHPAEQGAARERDATDGLRIVVREEPGGESVPGATVRANCRVARDDPRWRGRARFSKRLLTSEDGVAVVDRPPSGLPIEVSVKKPGYCAARVILPAERDEDTELRVALRRALDPRSGGVTLSLAPRPDVELEDHRIAVRGSDGAVRVLRSGATWTISEDPRGPDTAEVQLAVVGPGTMSEWLERRVKRGEDVILEVPVIDRVPVSFLVQDAVGRPVADCEVRLEPMDVHATLREHADRVLVTGEDGTASATVERSARYTVRAQREHTYFPPPAKPYEVWTAKARMRIRGWVKHRVWFEFTGLPPADDEDEHLQLRWRHLDLSPASRSQLAEDGLDLAAQRIAEQILDELPLRTRIPSNAQPAEPDRLWIWLVPGAYEVEIATRTSASGALRFTVPSPTDSIPVKLVGLETHDVIASRPGGIPVGTVLIAHRAGWAERHRVMRALGRNWVRESAAVEHRSDAEDRRMWDALLSRQFAQALQQRRDDPVDVGMVRVDGRAQLPTRGPDTVWTVILPDGTPYLVPVSLRATPVEVRVPDDAPNRVRIRWRGAQHPTPRLFVLPEVLFTRGERDTQSVLTWRGDQCEVNAFPGETFVVWSDTPGTRVTPASGAEVQRLPIRLGAWRVKRVGDGEAWLDVDAE